MNKVPGSKSLYYSTRRAKHTPNCLRIFTSSLRSPGVNRRILVFITKKHESHGTPITAVPIYRRDLAVLLKILQEQEDKIHVLVKQGTRCCEVTLRGRYTSEDIWIDPDEETRRQ